MVMMEQTVLKKISADLQLYTAEITTVQVYNNTVQV